MKQLAVFGLVSLAIACASTPSDVPAPDFNPRPFRTWFYGGSELPRTASSLPAAGLADISVMVLDGGDERSLDRAVAHIEGTAPIGELGNTGIAGHRDGIFRGLRHLEVGDALSLTSLDGKAHYVVDQVRVVTPSDVDVLDHTPHPTLTLVTCYPFYFVGDAPQRFIVRARQVRFEKWEPLSEAS